MIICLTSQGNELNSEIDPRFGRCKYFIFYNDSTGNFESFENKNAEGMGGVGIQSAQFVLEHKAEVVLTGKVGPNASEVLQSSSIKIVSDISGSLQNAIEAYKSGKFGEGS